ncbi:MAG: DUF488 domain-containing protein [Nitrospiria bacterium]
MLTLYTSRIGKYKGPDAFDVTVKSGDKRFAPLWDDVMRFKNGEIKWEEYQHIYKDRMRASYKKNRPAWEELLTRHEVTLLCYCPSPEHCHRLILVEILKALGGNGGVQVKYLGERPVAPKVDERSQPPLESFQETLKF